MHVLLLNPNMTVSVTERMADAARAVAGAETEIVTATATRGVPYISSRTEATVGALVALELLAAQQPPPDAAIVAAFGDPGLGAARELFDFPVVGVSEAAMLTASMLGRTFAIVTFSPGLVGWYQDCVDRNAMTARCAGIHTLDLAFEEVAGNDAGSDALIGRLAREVADSSGADSLILGGAPLAGLAGRLREHVAVPLVDPVAAALKQAEALVALGLRAPLAGSYRRPPPKPTDGLEAALAARIEHREP